jgi:uncharacterized lipoprotein YmbA
VYSVAVDVQQFEPDADGVVHLAARWALRGGRSRALLRVRETIVEEPAAAGDTAAGAVALSRTLGTLAREMVETIRRVHAGGGAASSAGGSCPPS